MKIIEFIKFTCGEKSWIYTPFETDFFSTSCNNLNKEKAKWVNEYLSEDDKWFDNIMIKSGPTRVWVHHLREDLRLLWAGHSYSPLRHVYKLFDGQLIRLNWYWIHQNIHHISYLLVLQGPKDSMYTRKKFQGLIKMMEYHLCYFRICLLKISKASNVQ